MQVNHLCTNMGVEPKIGVGKFLKSSILIGFSIIFNHPFWGTLFFFKHHMYTNTYVFKMYI